MTTTYIPRPAKCRGAKAKGLMAVDAFDTNWGVIASPNQMDKIEHEDGGWVFGIKFGSRYADQVCAQVQS